MYIVKRFEHGICLNGFEYLLDENDEVMEFGSPDEAVDYLNSQSDESLTLDEWEDDGVFIELADSQGVPE